MPKLKSGTIIPTDIEDQLINAAIATDPDTFDPSVFDDAKHQPFKRTVTLNLSPNVIDAFQMSGDGWQARIDSALQQWLTEHPSHG